MRPGLGLRARLVLLLAAAILPLCVLAVVSALREARDDTEMARRQLQVAAQLLADTQERRALEAMRLLTGLALSAQVRGGDRAACGAYLRSVWESLGVYANIGLADPDGQVRCHARMAEGARFGIAARRDFQRALAGEFAEGEVTVGPASGQPVIPYSLPVRSEAGAITGVVYVTLDLAQVQQRLYALGLPDGVRLALADTQGRIVVEGPSRPDAPLPRKLVNPQVLAAAAAMQAGSGEGLDRQGVLRVYAHVPSQPVGGVRYLAIASADRAVVVADTRARLRDSLVLLLLVLAAGIALAWWVGGRTIVQPATRVVATARALASGDLQARIPRKAAGAGEFARIAEAFNTMADSLQVRRRELELELQRSRAAHALLAQVINAMHEGVVAVDPDGNSLMHNEAAVRGFGLPHLPASLLDWLAGLGLQHADALRDLDPAELPLQRALAGESGAMRLRLPAPQPRLLRASYGPIAGADGRVVGALMVFDDVTELERLQHEQQGLVRMLGELNAGLETRIAERTRELEAFSHSISHDLRSPLGTIAGFARALQDRLAGRAEDERLQHFLARIQAGVARMEQLIDALLSLARISREPLAWEPVDLSALAREVAEELQVHEPGRAVDWQLQDGLHGRGDPRLLRSVLQNLLGNGWKFTRGVHAPRIEFGCERVDGQPVFHVRDNGVGFDMRYVAKLFTPFQRLHLESEFPGTGVGLATVQRILARHRGRVWAQSAPGRTTFFFTLGDSAAP